MRHLHEIAFAIVLTSVQFLIAQKDHDLQKILSLEKEKEEIISAEKETLKDEVASINNRLANNEISKEEAQRLKELLAKKRALNIENRLTIIDNKIELLKRNGADYAFENEKGRLQIGIAAKNNEDNDVLFGINYNSGKDKKVVYDRRTTNSLVLGIGLNNAIRDGQSINDLDYKLAGSRFFEIGWVWSTRVFKNNNFLRFNYGISYSSEGLKPTNNRYFVKRGDITELQPFRIELDKSKFRLDNFILPIHFELGPSKFIEREDRIRYDISKNFRFGIGGFVGVNVSTRQKLKYQEDGDDVKDKLKKDYNTNDFLYGLSSYMGFGDTTLYLKYTLTPIFNNQEIDQNNISLGLRFDL